MHLTGMHSGRCSTEHAQNEGSSFKTVRLTLELPFVMFVANIDLNIHILMHIEIVGCAN